MDKRAPRRPGSVLYALPLTTFADIAAHGLELYVWCSRCKQTRSADIPAKLLGQPFAGQCFRCQRIMITGEVCDGLGHPSIRPPMRRNPGANVWTADLYCGRCAPPWEILEVDHQWPPPLSWLWPRRRDARRRASAFEPRTAV